MRSVQASDSFWFSEVFKCLFEKVYDDENMLFYWKKGTLLKQTIEKSIYKDCGEGKVLIRLKIQS